MPNDAVAPDGGRSDGAGGGKKKRKGSFWRELPLLIVIAVVLVFVIHTFVGRIYVIPSASMERTLFGGAGHTDDRVAVDKMTYRFTDPAPGDVVVFKGPEAWTDNDEVPTERSGNPVVRFFQQVGSVIGLAPPDEKDFVKRVIAVGGQTVACCDAQNNVTVDGRPLDERPYLFRDPSVGPPQQRSFAPITLPPGQLWVMGDNRNNSADARFHGPIGVTDVIGKARFIVLPVNRWGGVPAIDPQKRPVALGPPSPASGVLPAAGGVLAVPALWGTRRLRHRLVASTVSPSTCAPPFPDQDEPGPAPAARSAAEPPRRRPDTAARSAAEPPRRRPDTAARSAAEPPRRTSKTVGGSGA